MQFIELIYRTAYGFQKLTQDQAQVVIFPEHYPFQYSTLMIFLLAQMTPSEEALILKKFEIAHDVLSRKSTPDKHFIKYLWSCKVPKNDQQSSSSLNSESQWNSLT